MRVATKINPFKITEIHLKRVNLSQQRLLFRRHRIVHQIVKKYQPLVFHNIGILRY